VFASHRSSFVFIVSQSKKKSEKFLLKRKTFFK
jgi:hypothetical protein